MRILSWNVRGLKNPRTICHLKHKLKEANPSIAFLIETKLQSISMVRIRQSCDFPNGFEVDSMDSQGGLSLGWKHNVSVTLRSFSGSHIDVLITDDWDGNYWQCTGFYGAPHEQGCVTSWQLLRQLNDCLNILLVVFENFNEILFSFKKMRRFVEK